MLSLASLLILKFYIKEVWPSTETNNSRKQSKIFIHLWKTNHLKLTKLTSTIILAFPTPIYKCFRSHYPHLQKQSNLLITNLVIFMRGLKVIC